VGTIPVSISSSDVEGIVLSVVPALSVPGRLRIDGQLPANLTIEQFGFRLQPLGANNALQNIVQIGLNLGLARPAADGAFRLNNIPPGEYRLDFMPAAAGFLKEVRFDGADVLNSPLRLSGTSTGTLDVVLGISGGRIDGVVTDARSQPVPGMRVVTVPDRARFRPDLYKIATTDQNGRFSLQRLSPGDYKVYSWESIEENAWWDPEVLSRFETRGRSVHVTETSTETIDVRVIPAEGSR
jgi:hypothetical protein